MSKTIISTTKTGKTFLLSTPPWEMGKAKDIPSRKWQPKRKLWSVPAVRLNVEYLKRAYADAEWTPGARELLASVERKASSLNTGEEFPLDYQFKTSPRPYQMEGLKKIWPLKTFGLFMDMRTGKSKVVVDYFCAKWMKGEIDGVLVVCPNSIKENFQRQILEHAPHPGSIYIDEAGKKKAFNEWMREEAPLKWFITAIESYSQGSAIERAEIFMAIREAGMVIDESSRIKNPSAARSLACRDIGRKAKFKGIMTGTPINQAIQDLYMQFQFLDPQIVGIGDSYSFRNRYVIMGGFDDRQVVGYQNVDELMDFIRPYVFQARKKEVMKDLPPRTRDTRYVTLSPTQKKMYIQMAKESCLDVGDNHMIVSNILEKMLRLHEIVGGFYGYVDDVKEIDGREKRVILKERIKGKNPKIDELMAVIEELDEEDQIIIWAVYKEEMAMIKEALEKTYGDQVAELHGAIPNSERYKHIDDFQSKRKRFFLGNAATGGMGLELAKGRVMIYFSNTFKAEDRWQSEERNQSSHQTQETMIIDLVCKGTVDTTIIAALKNKKDVAEYVRSQLSSGIVAEDLYHGG